GRFFAETSDKVRSLMAIVNPTGEDVTMDVFLTDKDGTSTDPVTLTIPANGALTQALADAPINLATGNQRTVNFTASAPVFVTGLRFFTNERGDSLLTYIPIGDVAASDAPIVI